MIISCTKENNVRDINDNVEINNENNDENDSEIHKDVSCENIAAIDEHILDVMESDKAMMKCINVIDQCVENSKMYNDTKYVLNRETGISHCLPHRESINNSIDASTDSNVANCNTMREGEDHNFFEEVQGIARQLTILTDAQRNEIVKLLYKYKTLFTEKAEYPDIYHHKIRLTTSKPIVRKSYPIPFSMRAAVDAEIDRMLQAGVIERSNSPYCSPLRIVTKGNGSIRICLDARHLNAVIESDNETPPPVNEILQKYYGKKIFTTTDLACGYWQIPLEVESRKFTAFLHGSTLYQFKRIPFGLKTAGSGFIRALSMALGNQFSDFLTCYVDDLLISSNDFDSHLHHLDLVFNKLLGYNFTLKLSKSMLCRRSVPFLGFILSTDGIQPNPEKLNTIVNFQPPRSKVELQRFLGICNYYRVFSVKYATFIDPFRNLLQKDTVWRWTDHHDQAFRQLKENFLRTVSLQHLIPGRPLRIQTDASNKGISGILYQIDDADNHRIISLVSRCLSAAEKNYTTSEKELLAIVFTIQKYRIYLKGNQFEIVTDHRSLTYLNNSMYLNARLMRWSLYLQQYDFKVSYCRGIDNVVADFFSRNPNMKFEDDITPRLTIFNLDAYITYPHSKSEMTSLVLIGMTTLNKELAEQLKNLSNIQSQDPEIATIIEKVKHEQNYDRYIMHNDVLFHRNDEPNPWRIVIPQSIHRDLTLSVHDRLGHPGAYKTTCYINQFYYWKSMRRQIKKIVITCDLCQRVKYNNQSMENEYRMIKSKEPGDLVTVDFYGPLPRSIGGVQYIFVVLDAFSKLVKLYPVKRATTKIIVNKILNNYIPSIGKPKRILSDHGTQFTAAAWRNALQREGIKLAFSSVRHPQSNPTERVMRELGRLFRTLCSDQHTKWGKFVNNIENLLNITTHASTGYTPYEVHYGRPITDVIQNIISFPNNANMDHNVIISLANERLKNSFERRKTQQKTISKVKLKEGDLVLLKVPHLSKALDNATKKFFHIYEGPYRIAKAHGNNAYCLVYLNDPRKEKGIYNHINLKKYYPAEE